MSFIIETEEANRFKNVFDKMQDDISKEIYLARIMYSCTDEHEYLDSVLRKMHVLQDIRQRAFYSTQPMVLFGAGNRCKIVMNLLNEINWLAIVDNNKFGKKINGIDVISVEEMRRLYPEACIIVTPFDDNDNIYNQLLKCGCAKDDIILIRDVSERYQYFDLEALTHSKNEVFVDVGSYDGASALNFIEWCNGYYDKIILFEAERNNMKICMDKLKKYNNIRYCPMGVWDRNTYLDFSCEGDRSHIVEKNTKECGELQVTSLDEYLKDEIKTTYINLDIEGAEQKALMGAKKIIKEQKPKLAISIYHNRMDILQIPMQILEYNPDYKFYLRIYSITGNDTVLYAI